MGAKAIRCGKDAKDLVLRKNVWADGDVQGRKQGRVWQEASWFSPATVEAEVVDDPHPVPSHAGSQGFMGAHPTRKRVLVDVCGGVQSAGQISIEVF
jgi:hypothetical protein